MIESNQSSDKSIPEDWQNNYRSMITSARDAISRIRPGQRVFVGTGCAQPRVLVEALINCAKDLDDIEIIHLLTLSESSFGHRELAEHFRINSFFIEGYIDDIQANLGDYTPIFLSDIPQLFHSGRLPLDVALIQVTPPNEQGMCSLGISVDITKSAAENAELVIAQVNSQMPWTMGDSLLHIQDIDMLVPTEMPLLEAKAPALTESTYRIAEYIAPLIPDGSTVELGIKSIPHAVVEYLKDKHDLGIHTEILSDTVIDLIESGAITGTRKNIDRGKIVASLCMGTRKLYDYIAGNPIFSFRPAEYVCDPYLISQQHNMVAISVALEVDLTGQVGANSLEAEFFSGMGSHMDFTHGASRATGGVSIIALDSTRNNGKNSRIVTHLSRGYGVAATYCEVHYVATEYGVAYLHGKSLSERALALISIAHPKFQAELLKEAIKACYVGPDLAAVEGKILVGPQELRTSLVLDDGTRINFRTMHPTDEKRLRDLFHSLSMRTLHYRFMSNMTRIPLKQVQNFLYTDYRNDMAIVGTIPEAHGEDIIAIGRYYLNLRTNRAEVAFIVRDEWQNRGIGTFLLKYMITIARRNGIAGFTAEVLLDNKSMLAVLHKSDCKIHSRVESNVYIIDLDFVQ